jgi:hypothetical protein
LKRLMFATFLISTALTQPVQAAPVVGVIAAAATWYASIGVVGQALVQIGIGLALTAASYGISYLLSGGGKRQRTAQQDNVGVQIEELSGVLERRRLYGEVVVSGGVFFQKTIAGSGTLDVFVKGYTISDGICDGISAIIINGIECALDSFGNPQTAPWYNVAGNYLKVSFRSGASDQAMDSIIAARWASPPADFHPDDADRVARWAKFRQRGVSTVVVEMLFGVTADKHTELWGVGGIPDLKFRVRGLHKYDPRDTNQSPTDATTWTYNQNASLAEADWLISDGGFGIDPDDIEWDSVRESADIDDYWQATIAGSERRGRVNGLVFGSEANDDVMASMALQNRAIIRRSFGKYSIRADRTAEPVMTIHQGLITGPLSYQNEPDTRAAINRAEVQFAPSEKESQTAETFFEDAALIIADGQVLPQRLSLRFCDSPAAAQRLGYATIKENRVGRTLSGTFDLSVLTAAGKPNGQLLEAGDVVRVWFSVYQAMNGLYTVTGLEIMQDVSVGLSLAGYDPDTVDGWTADLETPFEDAA